MWLLSSLTYAFSDYSFWRSSIFFKGNGDALSNGVEALKTLAMVAVGFLFGSSAKSGS